MKYCSECGKKLKKDANFCESCGWNIKGKKTGSKEVEYGGFWIRLIAYLIDGIVISLLSLLVMGLLILIGGLSGFFSYYFISPVLGIFYWVYFIGKSGQTPGKAALGLKVVNEKKEVIGYGKALLRYIGYFISGLVFGLGYLWIAFDSKKQGWHDKIAGSYVIRV